MEDTTHFVESYYRYWREEQFDLPDDQDGPDAWAQERWLETVHADADPAWQMLLEILEGADDSDRLITFAAGPLTDYIYSWASVFHERLVQQARRSSRFRAAMDHTMAPWVDHVPKDVERQIFELLGRDPEKPWVRLRPLA